MSAAPVIALLGSGSCTPKRVVTNDELSRQVDTSDEWIHTRTGIRERRIAAQDESTAGLATQAALAALADARLNPSDIDLLVVATCSPDTPMPSTACVVQTALGLGSRTACMDVNAACTGFIYALETAWSMLQTSRYRHALVVGAERMSAYVDWKDRTTCVLFGDGAGAVILGPAPLGSNARLIDARLGALPGTGELLHIPTSAGNPSCPPAAYINMKGREVFKFAVRGMEEIARDLLARQGLKGSDLNWVVPHQANLRIIHALAEYLELPRERLVVNLDRYGNTSAASIPIALDEARRDGRIQAGDLLLLLAFGAGLTCGGALIRC